MKLQIDNLDGLGPRDYSSAIDGSHPPRVLRKINAPSELQISLVANSPDFLVPAVGARVTLGRSNGSDVFSGYLVQAPTFEYMGWGRQGPVYRYDLVARSDEALLDEKRLADRCPFVERSAGAALRQLTQDLAPGVFDTSKVQDLDSLARYASDPQKTWSQEAAEIAVEARATYRVIDGQVIFAPVGSASYALNEADPNFNPQGLTLQSGSGVFNDVTVIGEVEPQAYVKDYFIGDGLTTRFYLSQTPFVKSNKTLFDEEYTVSPLDGTLWCVTDPSNALSVSGGKLQIVGGTGVDGGTSLQFVEKVELGGSVVLQHGDVMFNGPSSGVLGGLYNGNISTAGCLAGFRITPNGAQSNIQAVISGVATGTAMATVAGHHYLLTTCLYSQEIYRQQQTFHSSLHPAGAGVGGGEIPANVRVVLEVQDIDPTNPASQVAAATVLYDGIISGAPDFCTYALVNAAQMQSSIAFTRMIEAVDAEVRSALPGQGFVTQLVGPLEQGALCKVNSSAELSFYSSYVPAANQQITVRYRGQGHALARVTNPASIAAQKRGIDDGVHAVVRHIKLPPARTALDCEHAALAILDDCTSSGWKGAYQAWSDFLPGGANDIFPGDALSINVPSRGAAFSAIVRAVDIDLVDLADDRGIYQIGFANDAAEPLAWEFNTAKLTSLPAATEVANTQIGSTYLVDLSAAEITEVTSTTLRVDAGTLPPAGGGIEARASDTGWESGTDSNLIGRYSTRTFTIPRLARVQNCYLRQYDASTPPRYSRVSCALHVDSPL